MQEHAAAKAALEAFGVPLGEKPKTEPKLPMDKLPKRTMLTDPVSKLNKSISVLLGQEVTRL